MGDILDIMKQRRSIRRYKPDDVPDELLYKIMEAARWAPSGDNAQPWRFIVVRDPALKQRMGEIAQEGSARRFTAEYHIGRLQERFEKLKDPEKLARAFRKLKSGEVSFFLAEAPVVIIVCAKLDVWDVPYDAAMATEHMMLMATSLGLGTCCVVAPVSDMRDDIEMMELLKVPHGYKIVCPLAIGYPDESPNPRPRLPLEDLVYHEEFGQRRVK
ncbi:MAG: nitroreductase family protein [Desulfatiglandales bacterium]